MNTLSIGIVLCSASMIEVLAFTRSSARVFVPHSSTLYAESKGFIETIQGWLLPVKQGQEKLTVGQVDEFLANLPKEQSDAYDERFFASINDYAAMKRAGTMQEYLDSPAFPTDRTLARKRPYVWPGNRPPLPNYRRLDQSMDAAWGRGKYRQEIWNDVVNPSVEWEGAFAPSDEEEDAILGTDQHGPFNFEDPEAWCKEKGLEYETVMSEWEALREAGYKAFKEEEKKQETLVTQQEYRDYLTMKDRVEKQSFIVEDDRNQKLKGQPTLEGEDDGKQFWNDAP